MDAKHMKAKDARDAVIVAIKETIKAVSEVGKSHITMRTTDISKDVREQMELEGFRFIALGNQLLPSDDGKTIEVVQLYKISW